MFSVRKFERNFYRLTKEDMGSWPYSFCRFWNWKVRIEGGRQHILDSCNVDEAFERLSPTLRRWRWSRPEKHSLVAKNLLNALRRIEGSYDQIRSSSLLDFDKVSIAPLKQIWDELGKVKPSKNRTTGENLIMAVTKPLMFLWGQTPAFDIEVRRNMVGLKLIALNSGTWTFDEWYASMKLLQTALKKDAGFVNHIRTTWEKEVGINSLIPFGRLLDIYYYYK